VDELGRVRIFHGVNVVVKSPPYLPPTTPEFNPFDSLVRLLVGTHCAHESSCEFRTCLFSFLTRFRNMRV
jgi:hypothetical protein